MKIIIGDAERESRRGSYWYVDVVLVRDDGSRHGLAATYGDTPEIAAERAAVVADAFGHRVETYKHGGKIAPLRAAAELKKLDMLP